MASSLQLDLFEAHARRLVRGRGALADFDLPAAKREFEEFLSAYPEHPDARRGLALAARLQSRTTELEAEHGDRVKALLVLEGEIDDDCREGWSRRLAREAEMLGGDGCRLPDGTPAGLHWMRGGALHEAERSLRHTLKIAPDDAPVQALVGDVLFLKGDPEGARWQYLHAFLTDPSSVAPVPLADPDVAGLPIIARDDYQVPGSAAPWVPAVGTVEGVFSLPAPLIPGLQDPALARPEQKSPGFDFYRCLLQERAASSREERVSIRRRMKALCPALLAAYLERFYLK